MVIEKIVNHSGWELFNVPPFHQPPLVKREAIKLIDIDHDKLDKMRVGEEKRTVLDLETPTYFRTVKLGGNPYADLYGLKPEDRSNQPNENHFLLGRPPPSHAELFKMNMQKDHENSALDERIDEMVNEQLNPVNFTFDDIFTLDPNEQMAQGLHRAQRVREEGNVEPNVNVVEPEVVRRVRRVRPVFQPPPPPGAPPPPPPGAPPPPPPGPPRGPRPVRQDRDRPNVINVGSRFENESRDTENVRRRDNERNNHRRTENSSRVDNARRAVIPPEAPPPQPSPDEIPPYRDEVSVLNRGVKYAVPKNVQSLKATKSTRRMKERNNSSGRVVVDARGRVGDLQDQYPPEEMYRGQNPMHNPRRHRAIEEKEEEEQRNREEEEEEEEEVPGGMLPRVLDQMLELREALREHPGGNYSMRILKLIKKAFRNDTLQEYRQNVGTLHQDLEEMIEELQVSLGIGARHTRRV